MKKIYLTGLSIFAGFSLFAQGLVPVLSENFKLAKTPSLPSVQSVDTLFQYLDRASSATIYSSTDGGYVFGTSYVFDTATQSYFPVTDETGMHYDAVANSSVTEILFWAGKSIINGTAENITGNVYTVGTDSMPVNLISNGSISMNDVLGSNTLAWTSVPVNPPANTSGNPFFVSIGYAGVDDTLGIVSSNAVNGDGLGEKRIRQLANSNFGGAWARMGELYNFLDLDVFIIPIVDITSGVSDHFQINQTALKAVYPSPSKDFITVDYTLGKTADISYKLFDATGKNIIEYKKVKTASGHYSESIDVSQCKAGKYYLTFVSNGVPVTQKVVIVK